MKNEPRPTARRIFLPLLVIAAALLFSGCRSTHVGMGLNFNLHDGKVDVRPTASINLIGKPL